MNAQANLIASTEPTWLTELRNQCAKLGRKQVASDIGYSPTAISQALNDKYPGDLGKLERAVRGAYLGETVLCPVLGELEVQKCLKHQRNRQPAVNPTRVAMARACHSGNCPNSDKYKEQNHG